MEISGKTAFVTGGASGIGLAVGRALAAEGMHVALADIDLARLEEVAATIPGEVMVLRLDVRDRAQWAAARQAVAMRIGLLQSALRRRLMSPGGRPLRLNRFDPRQAGDRFADLDAMAELLWSASEPSALGAAHEW